MVSLKTSQSSRKTLLTGVGEGTSGGGGRVERTVGSVLLGNFETL